MKKPKFAYKKSQYDSLRMIEAIERLEQLGHSVTRCSKYQIKVGALNFWPDKGSIKDDSRDECDAGRGLDAFIALLPKPRPARPDVIRVDITN